MQASCTCDADYRSLSVPSSSGKSLQPRVTRTASFGLPPFSPLFIGEDSSTVNAAYQRSDTYLSVPSSSGKSLQREHLVLRQATSLDFQSPLHRGSLFNRSSMTRVSAILIAFQSPLHRGRLFNTGLTCSAASESVVFQSPLHRGSLFNDVERQPLTHADIAFQSPLHRGSLFNDALCDCASMRDASFSPLFIGEVSSTSEAIARCASRYCLSVPSSSGKSLQRSSTGSIADALCTFSPLFIGEDSSTAMCAQPHSWRVGSLSVPSSSGKTLQPLFIPCRFNNLQAAFYQIFRNGLICRKTRQVCENTNRMCVRAEH